MNYIVGRYYLHVIATFIIAYLFILRNTEGTKEVAMALRSSPGFEYHFLRKAEARDSSLLSGPDILKQFSLALLRNFSFVTSINHVSPSQIYYIEIISPQ